MNGPNGNGVWWKLAGSLVPLAIVGALAMAALKADVRHLQDTVNQKANRETVEAQYQALLRELQAIRGIIERLGP